MQPSPSLPPGTQPNRQELSPIFLLERAGEVFAERPAVTDGDSRYTWREFRARARRFASALRAAGLQKGDRVAFLAFNSEPLLLAHFAVPLAGGILVAINTRLNPEEIAYIVSHSGAAKVFVSPELEPQLASVPSAVPRTVLGAEFEALLQSGSEAPVEPWLASEDEPITINYTSGTTGRPKGVVYHHRGAYLNALAMVLDHRVQAESQYLWTLPMFHCNGWCFTWGLAAVGAESICIPKIEPGPTWQLFDGGVTHFCAAPTVCTMLVTDPAAHRLAKPVRLFTAGAPPSPTLIARMAELNFQLDHVYGLTEVYGPFTINVPAPGQDTLPLAQQAELRARQGMPNVCAGEVRIVGEDMNDVPRDGATMGEVVMRGNVVMTGYFEDPEATAKAFHGGWFHSGDLGVQHPDGAIELRDRAKDIIISGGENISTIEVEQALVSHPAVMECAVIAVPDPKWGEVPKAFVTLKPGASATTEELVAHCRTRLANFKLPRHIEFGALPKTSTGKIQKFLLRDREWQGRKSRIN
ncbi:MAG: AMP-binding protein [Holophagaceae bacterium]|jgi:fatty-acyl-CoA synthase|uniref:AMP-binding protein n=1 Tax=Candidatus Geothrix odensensis TaxID=2954440 RepID=A0A936K6V7_9BACT|nr:AMP-binding protein [Candidatus Geothrix odensensis]